MQCDNAQLPPAPTALPNTRPVTLAHLREIVCINAKEVKFES